MQQAGELQVHDWSAGVEFDESGTHLSVALRPRMGAHRWHTRVTAPLTADEAVEMICALLTRAMEEARAQGEQGRLTSLGVALWGRLEPERGIVLSTRFGASWEGYPLAANLAERLGVSVRLTTTTAAAARAEGIAGAGQGRRSLLYVLLARGITSALVASGRVVMGEAGAEGQLGHWRIAAEGPRCSCGARGHLEPLASAQALVRNLIGIASGSDESTEAMLRISGRRAEAMSAVHVARLAKEGDAAAQHVLTTALDALSLALGNLVVILDPQVIVLGGPLATASDAFLAPLRQGMESILHPPFAVPPLLAGKLEPFAPLIGASLLGQASASTDQHTW